jgi:hypothetical protein
MRRLPSSARPGRIAHDALAETAGSCATGHVSQAGSPPSKMCAYPTKRPQPVEADIRPLGGSSRFDLSRPRAKLTGCIMPAIPAD